jgi:hypothetical protein
MVVILTRHYTIVVFSERIASVNATLAVIVHAAALVELSVTGSGETRGQRRERESQ